MKLIENISKIGSLLAKARPAPETKAPKMKIIDDLFSLDLIKKIQKFSRSSTQVRTSLTSWDSYLIHRSSAIVLVDIKGDLAEEVKNELRPHLDNRWFDAVWGISVHVGPMASYIPWHNDGQAGMSVTCYFNNPWEKEWAGYFIYEDDGEMKCIVPQFNRGMIYEPPILHTVALSSPEAPLRESLQIFIAAGSHDMDHHV